MLPKFFLSFHATNRLIILWPRTLSVLALEVLHPGKIKPRLLVSLVLEIWLLGGTKELLQLQASHPPVTVH